MQTLPIGFVAIVLATFCILPPAFAEEPRLGPVFRIGLGIGVASGQQQVLSDAIESSVTPLGVSILGSAGWFLLDGFGPQIQPLYGARSGGFGIGFGLILFPLQKVDLYTAGSIGPIFFRTKEVSRNGLGGDIAIGYLFGTRNSSQFGIELAYSRETAFSRFRSFGYFIGPRFLVFLN